MKSKIDIKLIFIFVLAGALILSLIFRPSNEIDMHEDELKQLELSNQKLQNENDSIKLDNIKLNEEVQELIIDIDSTQAALADTEDRLNDIENDKGKVSGYVNTLDADGIAESLTEYLNRR